MGGTSEAGPIAEAIAAEGFSVLVSMATDTPLAHPPSSAIELRQGRLDVEQLSALIAERGITALVDAAHPFAMDAHRTAEQAAANVGIPYLHWLREESALVAHPNLHFAQGHEQAAQLASGLQRPILLTVGSRNLVPYVRAARIGGLPIFARVLPGEESEEACRIAGLHDSEIIRARGPFTVEDTRFLLRSLAIGTLVTKESGPAGGVPEKLEAAIGSQCHVVVVQRAVFAERNLYRTIAQLTSALIGLHSVRAQSPRSQSRSSS